MPDHNNPKIYPYFFYQNIFENENKARVMECAVKNNLRPFSNLLGNLLENNDRLSSISADVEVVETTKILTPCFSIIKIDTDNKSRFKIPEKRYYILEWKDEYEDDNFEITDRKRTIILNKNNKIDLYKGNAIFECDSDITTKLTLWIFDTPYPVEMQLLNFENDFENDRYRIESYPKIEYIHLDDGFLTCSNVSNSIKLFDSIELEQTKNNFGDISNLSIDDGVKYKLIQNGYCIIFAERTKIIRQNNKVIKFHNVQIEEYAKILNDDNLIFKNGKFILNDDFKNDDDEYTSNHGAIFKCNVIEYDKKLKYPNGTFIRLSDDDSYDSEIYSSSSFFFREDIDELSDTPFSQNSKRKRFKIGKRIEDENIIEIVEISEGTTKHVNDIPKKLFIISNPYQLRMQMNAVNILMNEPAPHHKNLIRLMDDRFKWKEIDHSEFIIKKWYILKNDHYDGVEDQRRMVKLALCTEDFAFLEGPPGSGKTTTILEIIAQLIMNNKRVMLAASTNAAIDNILERLVKLPDEVKDRLLPIRIGNEGLVNENVDEYRPENLNDGDLREIVFHNANLVCGTTFGILKHPEFNLNTRKKYSYDITPELFDCLIIDEASKTTFQDFLVPAIYARKWILSGDIKQLTPYIDKEDIAGAIRHMSGFEENKQEILGLIQQITLELKQLNGYRFTIPIKQENIPLIKELMPVSSIYVCIADLNGCIRPKDVIDGTDECMTIYGSDFIFIDREHYEEISKYLPSASITLLKKIEDDLGPSYRNEYYYKKMSKKYGMRTIRIDNSDYKNIRDIRENLTKTIRDKDWSGQIAWRIARQQELFMLKDIDETDKVSNYKNKIDERIPEKYKEIITDLINPLQELAMPSILQLLKQGMSDDLIKERNHPTVLNGGFTEKEYASRSILLRYQSRMHPEISEFSRMKLYDGEALIDNSATDRDWSCNIFPHHSYWLDVRSQTDNNNDNPYEIEKIFEKIDELSTYTKNNPKKIDPEDKGIWTVAILTYYSRQENNIKYRLYKKYQSNNPNKRTYRLEKENLKIEVYSVDKYQGKEADIVFISMVKSGKVGLGFMDSPNRLNVILTRAKYQRIIVGNKSYFKSCKNKLLKELAEESP